LIQPSHDVRGLRPPSRRKTYRARSRSLGLRLDVTNVAEALELPEEPQRRWCCSTLTCCCSLSMTRALSTPRP